MAGKKVFHTKNAPEPKGPYSQAVIGNRTGIEQYQDYY
jgi:enamine deaminase RidA (YjgF/YER057c/UK114 family)